MQLYIKLYPDQLSRYPTVEAFVKGVWDLVGSGKMPAVADDAVSLISNFSVAVQAG